jgi:FkbM family methyltransferase
MEFIKSYFRWHLFAFDKAYVLVMFFLIKNSDHENLWNHKLRLQTYTSMFNFRSRFLRRAIRISFDYESNFFQVSEAGIKRYFRDAVQNFYVYQNGIKNRGIGLGTDYFLDLVEFSNERSVVIDCGANIGDLKLSLDFAGINCHYIAFEPSPSEYECLTRNAASSELHNIGLWNKDAELALYISTKNADSSFIEPDSYSGKITILAKRLDQIYRSDLIIDLIKLEAEGAEIEVIEGAENILPRTRYIAADLGFERNGKSTLPQVTNFLLERGFEIVSFGAPRIVVLFRNTAAVSSTVLVEPN